MHVAGRIDQQNGADQIGFNGFYMATQQIHRLGERHARRDGFEHIALQRLNAGVLLGTDGIVVSCRAHSGSIPKSPILGHAWFAIHPTNAVFGLYGCGDGGGGMFGHLSLSSVAPYDFEFFMMY